MKCKRAIQIFLTLSVAVAGWALFTLVADFYKFILSKAGVTNEILVNMGIVITVILILILFRKRWSKVFD